MQRRFKHKPSSVIFEEGGCEYYVRNSTQSVPKYVAESGNDWEEVKEPIFTTEDGVEIFSNEATVFCVHTNNWIAGSCMLTNLANYKPGCERYGWKYFSTKKARLEYMVHNKPCFSYADIKDALHVYGMSPSSSIYRIIEEAIKEKLKASDSNL